MSFIRSTALTALAALALVQLSSCASETPVTDPSTAEVPFQSGALSGVTLGRLGPPQTTTSPGATLTGLVGTFTGLTAGGPALGNVATVYFKLRGAPSTGGGIWQVRTDGTGLQRLTLADSVGDRSPSISPSGTRLFFWRHQGPGDQPEALLMERLPDNTLRQVAADRRAFAPVAWTPDEKSVVYPYLPQEAAPPRSLIRLLDLETLTQQDLVPDRPYVFSPVLTVGPVNGHPVIIYINAERGLSRFDLTTGLDSVLYVPADSGFVSSVDLTRDGRQLLFALTRRTAPNTFLMHVRVGDPNQPEAAESLFTFPGSTRFSEANTVRWVPDGSGLVVTAPGDPGPIQLHLFDAQGHRVRQLSRSFRGVEYESDFSVGPPVPASQLLIGEGGLLGSTASGIIFGQAQGGGLAAVVGFQSDRPRTVRLTANTGLNSTGPALTYTLVAERLRTLRFINGPPDGERITVIDSTSGAAGGALINFSADNGEVTVVLPFAEGGNRAPTVTESGGTRVFQGNFLGVWKGRTNIAPRGASQVRLETATGRMEVTP